MPTPIKQKTRKITTWAIKPNGEQPTFFAGGNDPIDAIQNAIGYGISGPGDVFSITRKATVVVCDSFLESGA